MFLYANPEKRAEMGRNAALLARTHFDADGNAMKVLGVYRDAVGATAKWVHS